MRRVVSDNQACSNFSLRSVHSRRNYGSRNFFFSSGHSGSGARSRSQCGRARQDAARALGEAVRAARCALLACPPHDLRVPSVHHFTCAQPPSPHIDSRRACAPLMRFAPPAPSLCHRASSLKCTTRRLSCTAWCCSRLPWAPGAGTWRIRCRCWRPLASGCERLASSRLNFGNSGARGPLCDMRIASGSC